MTDLYDLVFSGEIDETFSKQEVKNNLLSRMGISEKQLDRLFSGQPIKVKKSVSKQSAESLSIKLKKLGAISQITPCLELPGNSPTNPSAIAKPHSKVATQPTLAVVEKLIEPVAQAASPQVIVYEKHIIQNTNQPMFVAVIFSWLSGLFWIIVGLGFMLAFSPFPGGTIRRGMLLGVVLFLLGVFGIWRRNRR